MACAEYHSPQFSEDPAWLPAWLHPYEQTINEFQEQIHGNATPVKACQFLQENLCKVDNAHLTTSEGAKYTSCNLYLSGDDSQQVGSSSSNAMHFHLHLSSTSISQVWPSQSNEIPDLHKYEMNKCSFQKIVSENPAITHGLAYQYLCKDPTPRLDSSPAVFKQNMSYEPNTDQPIKTNHSTEQECHGKLDGGGLKKIVVDDVVELAIAASEALVISEMAFGSTHFESFSDAAILEISLRVEHARKECTLETHDFSTADSDDNDKLSDLDENFMFNAFEDVGITVQQLVETSICPFTCRGSFKSAQGSDTKHVEILNSDSLYGHNLLAANYEDEREVLTEMIKGDDTCKTIPKICSPLGCKLQSNIIWVESGPQMQTNSLDTFHLDNSIPCLKDNSPEQEQNIHIIDSLPENQEGSMGHHCIQKVEKVSEPSNVKVRKSMKLFKWETSFLSESMDVLDQDGSQKKPSVEFEIVSSSDTALQASSSSFCKEKQHNHEPPLSQDYSRSLSLSDPLCSIVPCSISSEPAVGYESKHAIEAVGKSNNPMTMIYSKCLDENSTMQNNSMLQKLSLASEEFNHFETIFDQPSVPHRKQLNSLRPYSLVTNIHKKAEGTNYPCNQIPLYDLYESVMHSSSEVIFECSNKNDIELPGKCLLTSNFNNKQIFEKSKIKIPSIPGDIESDDTRPFEHKDSCSPSTLNCMIHPCVGYKVTTGGNMSESTKKLSTLNLGKCRSYDSTKKASYRNETIIKCHLPIQSCLHSFPPDKRLRKRVRFQEATCNMGVLKTSRQSKYPTHCSCSETTKQLQNHSFVYEPESGRVQNINYLASNGAVRNNAMILQGLEFLLTGFSSCKAKDIEELIRRHGGYVLQNIPSFSLYLRVKTIKSTSKKLPIVLCPKKVQTTKFLYGCAVNTFLLNYHWLEDSIHFGALLPPGKYMTLSVPGPKGNKLIVGETLCFNCSIPIFNKVGIMVHGKVKFCAKFMKIVKHGGGQVFKSLQRLVQSLKDGTNTLGIILVKNENCVSRHLKHCALEHDIPTLPASWIISSLFSGKLLPLKRDRSAPFHRIKMPSFPVPQLDEMSQEI